MGASTVIEHIEVLTVIITLIVAVWKIVVVINGYKENFEESNKVNQENYEKSQETINGLVEAVHKDHINHLKNTVFNGFLPIEERLYAGDEYIALGGNGTVKIKYNELLKQYESEVKRNESKLESKN